MLEGYESFSEKCQKFPGNRRETAMNFLETARENAQKPLMTKHTDIPSRNEFEKLVLDCVLVRESSLEFYRLFFLICVHVRRQTRKKEFQFS